MTKSRCFALALAILLGGCGFVRVTTSTDYVGPCGLADEAEALSQGGEQMLDSVASTLTGGGRVVAYSESVGRGFESGSSGEKCLYRRRTDKLLVQ